GDATHCPQVGLRDAAALPPARRDPDRTPTFDPPRCLGTLVGPEGCAIGSESPMSVTVRPYTKRGRKGWEVDINLLLLTGERFRERRKAPTTSKSGAMRWGEAR